MKKKFIWQCWLVSLLTSIIIFVATTTIFYSVTVNSIKQALSQEMRIYKELLENDFDGTIYSLKNVNSWNGRLSIFDKQGNAVFESDTNVDNLNNHLDREEIQYALQGNPQFVIRYSATMNTKMIYYAELTQDGNHIVRIALPTASLNKLLGTTIPVGIVVLIVALVISFLLATYWGKKAVGQFTVIRDSLHSLNKGNYVPIKANMTDTENYQVLMEINDISQKLNNDYQQLELERSQSNFIINNIAQGIVAFDKQGKVQFINNTASDMLGKSGEHTHYMVLLTSQEQCQFFEQCIAGQGEQKAEFLIDGKQIQMTFIHTSGTLSQRIAYLLILSDITAEKQWIKQKNRFFSNASHELKTPLTSIQGLSELLMNRPDIDSQTAKYLQRINTESIRMNNLVMDMLYIDRLDDEHFNQDNERVNLLEVVKESLLEHNSRIVQKEIKVNIEGSAEVNAGYRDMNELVSNIIGNAVNYNKQQGTIDIELGNNELGAKLVVRDSGIGIDSKHLPRVCERFYRVDKSRSKDTGGTGLGLSIVKHICLKYNAQLNIDSEVDKGTTVSVQFTQKANN